MVTIEQIDEFRRRTNSSYEDARFFLERHQGDVLEAIIEFEKAKGTSGAQAKTPKKGDFGRKIIEIIQKGFDIRLTVEDKAGSMLFTVPIFVLLFLTPIWPMILLACLGLIFLGYKLGFRDISTSTVDMKRIFENLGRQFQDAGRQQGPRAGQQNPGQQNPGQQNPGQQNPGQQNPGQQNPGQQNPVHEASNPYVPPFSQIVSVHQPVTQSPQPQLQPPSQPWQTATSPPSDQPLNTGMEKPVEDGFKEYTVE